MKYANGISNEGKIVPEDDCRMQTTEYRQHGTEYGPLCDIVASIIKCLTKVSLCGGMAVQPYL